MRRLVASSLLVLAACSQSPSTDTAADLSHLTSVLSAAQLDDLRRDAGLSDAQLAEMSPAQADKVYRKLHKPSETGPGDAFVYRRQTMVDENGNIPDNALMDAVNHRQMMVATDFDNGGIQKGSWRWVGPGNVGGRCRALWIQPSNPNVLVLGSVGGGIWRSTNAGGSWEPVHEFPASLAIGCMAGPKNSSTTIWAGTGEGFGNTDALRGAGIYVSYNSGREFRPLASTASNSNFRYVNRIAFSPTSSKTVLVATSTGLWRTTDSGLNWTRVVTGKVLDVKFHPTSGSRAICAGSGSTSVRHSTNGGLSWSTATGFVSSTRRVELAYARSNPAIVYASAQISGGTSRIYRSSNYGASFVLRNSTTGMLGSQGWYDNCIWVDPTNSNYVFCGGIRLWKSLNAGASWTRIDKIHADQHAIVPHPGYNGSTNRIVYICNDGGIFRTNNIHTASTSSGWYNLNNRISLTQFYGGAVSASGRPFGGTQDNGTQQLWNSTLKTFRSVRGADGMQCEADPNDYRYLYGEIQYAGVFRSTNGGSSSESIVNNMADSGSGKAPWIGALRLDPNNPNRLWLGSRRLWRTNNVKTSTAANVSWSMVRSTVENYSSVDVALGASSRVVAGASGGDVFRSTNATATSPSWVKIDGNLPSRTITTIRWNPRNHNVVYVSMGGFVSGNVWRTTNALASTPTWTSISGSGSTALPAAPVRALAVHPTNEGWLYAGTEVGVFASTDHGKTWSASNDGPATVSVDELRIKGETLYAFTHGRGVYSANVGTNQDTGARTTLASRAWNDVLGNNHSYNPSISGNGRYVAFDSNATNLYPGDNNARRDIFVRDRQAGTTERVSLSTNGAQANNHCYSPTISRDGRIVAFYTAASNLVSGDTNNYNDVFVRDRTSGITERISLRSTGSQSNGSSYLPSLTADGRIVVFYSYASNLVSGDTNSAADVFRYDRLNNICVRVSASTLGAQGNGSSVVGKNCISGDGKYVVFSSSASNLVGSDTNAASDVFLRYYGGRFQPTTTRISVGPSGVQANGASYAPSISGDGRYIVYYSRATNLVKGDTNARADIFLYDRITRTTSRVSVSSTGAQGNNNSYGPYISADGSTIAWESDATNLVTGDTNGRRDIFLRRRTGRATLRLSVDSERKQANNSSYTVALSEDGQWAAFRSAASNLVNNDTNGFNDIFVAHTEGNSAVFPLDAANKDGSLSTAYPLSRNNMRLQQVVRQSDGRPMSIRQISFRRNAQVAVTTAPQRRIDLSLVMGIGKIDAMTTRFSSNYAGLGTYVIDRKQFDVASWNAAVPGVPRFDVGFPLDKPYRFGGSGALLWDMRVYNNTATTIHPIDAHASTTTYVSSSSATGIGCNTNTGSNMGHLFSTSSNGASTTLSMSALRAPRNSPVLIAMGFTNPNFQIPGWCTRIYTDAAFLLPLGTTSSAGTASVNVPIGKWNPKWNGVKLYTQAFSAVGNGFLSYGRRYTAPARTPGPNIYRLWSSSRFATTGSLQTLGAVFKLDY